jgi:hypothetical protein
MKTILICPNQAHGLPVLADSKPLATLPIFGEAYICHWMQYLASEKFTDVRIVTTDPVEIVSAFTGDGSRWGIKVEVFHEVRDLSPEEARKRYKPPYEQDWPPEPLDLIEADHLPGLAGQKLFSSYESWFRTLPLLLATISRTTRAGTRELAPGIWVGRRTSISHSAKLVAPCWIGANVKLGKETVVGPNSFLEDQVVVDFGACVENSWVGPDTFLGQLAELKESLAWGNLLINWRTESHTFVPDEFLLTSLADQTERPERTTQQPVAERPRTPLAGRIRGVIPLVQKVQS